MRKLVLKDENVGGFNINDAQPVGEVITSGSNNTPAGYLPCDGRSLLRSEYPDLFSKIGTRYGADDELHFNLPNEIEISDTPSGHIYTCATAVDVATKEVTINDMDITTQNVTFEIFFANGNTASGLNISINGTSYTPKIYFCGTKKTIYETLDAGTILRFFYDGTDLVVTNNVIVSQSNTSTSGYTIYADGKNTHWKKGTTTTEYQGQYDSTRQYSLSPSIPKSVNDIVIVTACHVSGNWNALGIATIQDGGENFYIRALGGWGNFQVEYFIISI